MTSMSDGHIAQYFEKERQSSHNENWPATRMQHEKHIS